MATPSRSTALLRVGSPATAVFAHIVVIPVRHWPDLQRVLASSAPAFSATFWAVATVGTAGGLAEYTLGACLTIGLLFAHLAMRRLSAWIERVPLPRIPCFSASRMRAM